MPGHLGRSCKSSYDLVSELTAIASIIPLEQGATRAIPESVEGN